MYDHGNPSFIAGETLEAYRRVKLSAENTVTYADGTDMGIGHTLYYAEINTPVAIRLTNSEGIQEAVAAEAISVGAELYAAADGKVTADGLSGTLQKINAIATTAAATDDVFSIIYL